MLHRNLAALTIAVVVLLCSSAYADDFTPRGSALIAGVWTRFSTGSYSWTNIHVSNITGCDVECRVTVYDHAGEDVTARCCTVYSVSSSGMEREVIASGTGTLSLPAGATRHVRVYAVETDPMVVGHAMVEWSSENSHMKKALIIAAELVNGDGGNRATRVALPVIGSQPF